MIMIKAILFRSLFTISLVCLLGTNGFSYPLDGFERTGIERLKGYYYAAFDSTARKELLPDGARLSIGLVQLSLHNVSLYNIPVTFPQYSPSLSKALSALVHELAPGASLSACDISNPTTIISTSISRPICGHVNGNANFVAGSVGKLVVALTIYHQLARLYPQLEDRINILKNRLMTANEFVESDTHDVPFWIQTDKEGGNLEYRPLQTGDTANLWSYLDWMLSASSNGAANMVMREILLMKGFQKNYPPSLKDEKDWFAKTSPGARANLFTSAVKEAVDSAGLSFEHFRQSSLYTSLGKRLIPSRGSIASTNELVKFLFKVEQGKVIDFFTSLELKRLLYLTQSRSRYGAAPVLTESAIYFKSGSLYKCQSEKGYQCGQFKGNKLNLLNAAAIVESPVLNPKFRYIVALSTNQLKKDAGELHQRLATRVHQLFTNSSLRD